MREEHEKLIKFYQEKQEKLKEVIAKRDEVIRRNAEAVTKRIEDIQAKRDQQEAAEQDNLEALVKELQDKSNHFPFLHFL